MVSKDGTTAIIEMAKASGITLIQPDQYNPSGNSTYGTGELIRDALEKGVSKIILGIGGSATNDGGIGLAAALGYRFLDGNNQELPPKGSNLAFIHTIDTSGAVSTNHIEFLIACDVKNPLIGPMGATHVYAKQKGADPAMIEQLEQGMVHYASIIKKQLGIDISEVEGGGAAGGLGAGCLVFLNAKLVSGIGLVMQISGLEKHVKDADLVITGEGKVDKQSLQGKVVAGVCSLTKKYSRRTIIVCGTNQLEAFQLEALNSPEIYPIAAVGRSLQYSIANAAKLLEETGFTIGRNLQHNTG
jgi:glycerate kinase